MSLNVDNGIVIFFLKKKNEIRYLYLVGLEPRTIYLEGMRIK